MRKLSIAVLATLLVAACSPATGPIGDEPWRTSWTEFAQSVDGFRREAQAANPSAADFPHAGRDMMHMGEPVPRDWPVMRRFQGTVEFEGLLNGLVTGGDEVMSGRPFKLDIALPESGVPGFASVHIYPGLNSVAAWRAVTPGTRIRFRAQLAGVSAMDMAGGAFCAAMNMTDNTERRLPEPTHSQYNPCGHGSDSWLYIVVLTDAEYLGEAALESTAIPAPSLESSVESEEPSVGELIVSPQWLERPSGRDYERVYPRRAMEELAEGRVLLDCIVNEQGRLEPCIVVSEDPLGQGFAEAALSLAGQFRMAPQTRDGRPTAGAHVRIPIQFMMPLD